MSIPASTYGSISRQDLEGLIEPHIYSKLRKDKYVLRKIKGSELLSPKRFDLAFKLLLLNKKQWDNNSAMDAYTDHIRAFSFGRFTEPYNDRKKGIDSFLREFEKLDHEISESGFDSKKSIIPVSSDGILLNGAHRVACAIQSNSEILCVETELSSPEYTSRFFYKRMVNPRYLDMAAIQFVQKTESPNMCLSWGRNLNANSILSQKMLIYSKKIVLNSKGKKRLLRWLSTESYVQSAPSLLSAFQGMCHSGSFRISIFESIPNALEEIYLSEYSIFIPDHEKVLRLARTLLNEKITELFCSMSDSDFEIFLFEMRKQFPNGHLSFDYLSKKKVRTTFLRMICNIRQHILQRFLYSIEISSYFFKKSLSALLKVMGLYEIVVIKFSK